ncbi:MAG: hypothetical protein AAGH15_05635 [Myxococcota bacterium]
MGYRDPEEGLKAKVGALEDELAEAQRAIARLEGRAVTDGVHEEAPSRFLGAALKTGVSRELDGPVSEAGMQAIARMFRERLPPGAAPAQSGGRLEVRGPYYELAVENTPEGRCRVEARGDFVHQRSGGFLLAGFFSAIGLFAGGGLVAQGLPPVHMAWWLPAATVAATALARRLARGHRNEHDAQIRGVFETAIALAEEHRDTSAPGRRVRVAPDAEAPHELEAEGAVEEAAEA